MLHFFIGLLRNMFPSYGLTSAALLPTVQQSPKPSWLKCVGATLKEGIKPTSWKLMEYGGWKKSCTTWDGWNPMNNGINHLSTGAGFLPSTVCHEICDQQHETGLAKIGKFCLYLVYSIKTMMMMMMMMRRMRRRRMMMMMMLVM